VKPDEKSEADFHWTSKNPRAAARGAGAIRLTRAERGVGQHISRKFRVQESSIEQYASYARQAGRVYNIDPYLILAIMATESSFNPRAQSRVGAQGLMQVHTKMHKKRFKPYGSTDTVWEPKVNIQVGSSILSDYLKRYGGSERRALKAYVGAARMSHDGGYGNKVLRRRDEFVSVSVAASNNATSQAMQELLAGYEQIRPFERRELALVEPLRTLRIIRHSAWLAERWEDPAFPAAFPWFGSVRYWQGQIISLQEQLAQLRGL